jgi:hypothetical protein
MTGKFVTAANVPNNKHPLPFKQHRETMQTTISHLYVFCVPLTKQVMLTVSLQNCTNTHSISLPEMEENLTSL